MPIIQSRVLYLAYMINSSAGSAANGVGELDSLQGNAIAGTVTKIVGDVADAAVDELEDDSESEDD